MGKELGVYGGTRDPNLPPPVHCTPGSCPCFLSFLLLALNIMHCSIIPCISHASYPFTPPTSPLSSPPSGPLTILPGLPPPSPSQGQKDSRRTRPNSLPVLASNHHTKNNNKGPFQTLCYCRAKLAQQFTVARLQHDTSMTWFQMSNLIQSNRMAVAKN